ncbi:cytochrome d ubiquinol oxidase subunit II [Burkholderia anthina]|uniref:cytochrome d ubiquinol oxidase subunit II n=1 Tax=Burkholderia anthina TaxID=179879 RepID=UPI00158E327F|nr:cytochrome d ubiquinol oxidase subunit II [Burkholderia anthina]
MNIALSHVCILIAIFAVAMYVLLDGFDLGVGILLLSSRHGPERDALVDSIAPVWDGNETWLILAAIVLFGAFPLAYSILAPAFYLPFMVMLVSLAFRGVAIEFRVHTPFPRFWDGAFSIGSILAAFAQGLVAGALLSGDIVMTGGRFAGSTLDVFTGFSVLTGLAAIAAYASLGAAWLHWKTGAPRQHARLPMLRMAMFAFLLLAAAACCAASTLPAVAAMWHAHPAVMAMLGTVCVGLWIVAFFASYTARDIYPLLCNLAAVAVLLIGLIAMLWPYVVPFNLAFGAAAAEPGSQLMVAGGALVILPVILGYNAFAYWVFRGKVGASGSN